MLRVDAPSPDARTFSIGFDGGGTLAGDTPGSRAAVVLRSGSGQSAAVVISLPPGPDGQAPLCTGFVDGDVTTRRVLGGTGAAGCIDSDLLIDGDLLTDGDPQEPGGDPTAPPGEVDFEDGTEIVATWSPGTAGDGLLTPAVEGAWVTLASPCADRTGVAGWVYNPGALVTFEATGDGIAQRDTLWPTILLPGGQLGAQIVDMDGTTMIANTVGSRRSLSPCTCSPALCPGGCRRPS